MAIDEAIFRGVITSKTESTIRFYGSEPEAVSIGYFQDAKKDLNLGQCRHDGIDVVRRITGGRAVFHCNEITYSVTAGSGERIFPTTYQEHTGSSANVSSAGLAIWALMPAWLKPAMKGTREKKLPAVFQHRQRMKFW